MRHSTSARPAAPLVPHRDAVDRLAVRCRTVVESRLVALTLGIYLVMRVISAGFITWVAHHQDPAGVPGGPADGSHVSYWDMTRMWDGEWYRRIATDGYPTAVPRDEAGHASQSELAFYPLFPLLARAGMTVTGGSFAVVASLLSVVLGCAAVVIMVKLLERHVGGVAALCGATVYASSPPSPSLQMAYTESLAMVLVCGLLLALDVGNWSMAGVLALATGLSRPIAAPLALVALVVIGARWRRRHDTPIPRAEQAAMVGCLVSCGLSGALWPLMTWLITGEAGAYADTMGSWRSTHSVVPFEAWWRIADILVGSPAGAVAVVGVVIAFAMVVAGPWADGLGLVLRTWCVAYGLYLFATIEPWTSTYRYLLELFPLAVVLVGGGWKRGPSSLVVPLTALLVVINLALQGLWCWELLQLDAPVGNPI